MTTNDRPNAYVSCAWPTGTRKGAPGFLFLVWSIVIATTAKRRMGRQAPQWGGLRRVGGHAQLTYNVGISFVL